MKASVYEVHPRDYIYNRKGLGYIGIGPNGGRCNAGMTHPAQSYLRQNKCYDRHAYSAHCLDTPITTKLLGFLWHREALSMV